jgi:Arc/MetJ-type ribon-helix-helix transcriptional regulator
MKSNAKSSVTLPAEEVKLVKALKSRLRLKSNVEVVRRGLRLLQETTDRAALRDAYRRASETVRGENAGDMAELDRLSDEGLD